MLVILMIIIKKFNTIFKKYPCLLLNLENNELEGIGQSIFDEMDENEIKDNICF